jgi:glyoxylase-like metal-dependent hydrolase (beta-lactamase superfamily II)
LLEDGPGWAVVDTGLRSPESTAAWCQLIDSALDGRPVTRVFVTHMHPDHSGMAGWLTRKFRCPLWISRLEYLSCRLMAADTGREVPEDGVRFYHEAGWDAPAIDHYRSRFGDFGKGLYPMPDSFRRVVDGERLRIGDHEWKVVVGNGHSPEHACLHCAELGLLISGDQVLPRISSNVSVFPTEPEADPLTDWLASLAKLKREIPEDVLVLPAHNEPFHGLHRRLDHLDTEQRAALGRLHALLDEPRRAVDVFDVLFTRKVGRDLTLVGLATGEAIACLNFLKRRGEIRMELDRHGVSWYRRSVDQSR